MRLEFDDFELDTHSFQLSRSGARVPLERRALDLLCYLAANPHRLITRDELLREVWQASVLSEGVLANTVAKVRKALGQEADARQPIETVRGRGYRFHAAARVRELAPQPIPGPADPLVARSGLLADLAAALDKTSGGLGQLWVLAGEAGIGKTRVAREVQRLARERGFSVFTSAGHENGAALAYWPWVELLREIHLQLSAADWQRHLPVRHAALARLIPELCPDAGRAGGEPEPAHLRLHLFDELTQHLRSLSARGPCLYVMDDLHWTDPATVELLAHVASALEAQPIFWLATMREEDVDRDEAMQAALRRLARVAHRIPLPALTRDQVVELLGELEPVARSDAPLAEEIFRRSGGNPLFVRQLLMLLTQRGARSRAELSQLTTAELPPAMRSVIQRRLAGLEPSTLRVLSAAAVAGSELDAGVIASMLDQSIASVLAALEPAVALRLLEGGAPHRPHSFSFTHSLVRDVLYDALGFETRGAWHARLVQALLERGLFTDARQLADLAHHQLLALPPDLPASVRHTRAAAAAARACTGFEAAAGLLCRLIHKHESEAGPLPERCELLLELGSDQSCAGAMRAAWSSFARGAELARQLSAAELLAQFALRLAPWLEFGGGDEDYVRELLVDALGAVGDHRELRAALLAQRAQLEIEVPSGEREAWLALAESLARDQPSLELSLQLAAARASMRSPWRPAAERQAIAHYHALASRVRAGRGDPARLVQAFSVSQSEYAGAIAQGDLTGAAAAAASCRALARGANHAGIQFSLAMMDAGRALAEGDLCELEAQEQRLREAEAAGGGFSLAWLRYLVLRCHANGTLPAVLRVGEVPASMVAELPTHARAHGYMFLAWAHAQADLARAAERMLGELSPARLARLPLRSDDLGPMCLLAETYCCLGDHAGAARLLPQLEPFASWNALGPTYDYHGAVSHYLGELLLLLGEPRAARLQLDHALQANARLRMPLQLARTRAQRRLIPD